MPSSSRGIFTLTSDARPRILVNDGATTNSTTDPIIAAMRTFWARGVVMVLACS